jgi:RND family efflux transporter MFP subunit
MGTAPPHSSANASEQSPEIAPSEDAAEQTPSGGGPDAERLSQLRACLEQLLSAQCVITGAFSGVAFLSARPGRPGGCIAQISSPSAERNLDGAAVMNSATIERLARVAALVESHPNEPGVCEVIALPKSRAMYGEELRFRAFGAPLRADGKVEGACVVLARERIAMTDEQAIAAMAAAGVAFEAYLWREQCLVQTQQKLMLRETVELLDAAQQGHDARAMASIIAQELKRRFGCTRVSLGLIEGEFVRVAALSGADEIDRTAAAIGPLEAAMEECAAQDSEIAFPQAAQTDASMRRVTRAHEHLSRSLGPAAILSLPLRVEGGIVGVVVLEREPSDPLPLAAVSLLRLIAETAGPAVWTRRMADRGLFAVARDQSRELAREIAGPRHTGLKLVSMLLAAVFILALAVPIPSRISASGEVRAASARTISPPYPGYLSKVMIRPGDLVTKGQVIAEMDSSDPRLQLAQSQSELSSALTQRDESLSRSDLAKVAQFDADARRAQATVELLTDHIARATILAPFDGVVGRGDLEQFVHARVEPNQPLFEIVTSENLTIAYVDERDVQRVRVGQTGRFVSKALPGDRLHIRVDRITPVAEPHEGTNAYKVELTLDPGQKAELVGSLRPGMTGTVRLDDGWTTTLGYVLHPVIDELRLRFWW